MSRNNDTYMSSSSDDLFLNYNGFNNIRKSCVFYNNKFGC